MTRSLIRMLLVGLCCHWGAAFGADALPEHSPFELAQRGARVVHRQQGECDRDAERQGTWCVERNARSPCAHRPRPTP